VEGREREGPKLLLIQGPSEPCYATGGWPDEVGLMLDYPSEWGPSGTHKQTNIGPVCASATYLLCIGNNWAHTGHAKFAVLEPGR